MAKDKRKTTANRPGPRIMVTAGNYAVAHEVKASGGAVVGADYRIESAVSQLADCDGLIITGGGDVNPRIYGDKPHATVYGLTASRDLRELALIGAARSLGTPVLGICRGMQLIAVEAGGTLHQHIPANLKSDRHSCSTLPVRTVRGSVVARALGDKPWMVHLHHQAVRRVPKGFNVTARHADGTVEAIESFDGRVVGVQFHPEMGGTHKDDGPGDRLFDLFVSHCERFRRKAKAGRKALPHAPSYYVNRWPVAVEAYDAALWATPTWHANATPPRKSARESARVLELVPEKVDSPVSRPGRAMRHDVIVGWCGDCGVGFDRADDYLDHIDLLHMGRGC